MPVKFNQIVKHAKIEFLPGVSVDFEDPDAETYFKEAGWADATTDPSVRTYSQEEISIDPTTVFGEGHGDKTGKPVLPPSE
jgi:hypothetical protein